MPQIYLKPSRRHLQQELQTGEQDSTKTWIGYLLSNLLRKQTSDVVNNIPVHIQYTYKAFHSY